jgi:glucose/arabinose dehydrogenase
LKHEEYTKKTKGQEVLCAPACGQANLCGLCVVVVHFSEKITRALILWMFYITKIPCFMNRLYNVLLQTSFLFLVFVSSNSVNSQPILSFSSVVSGLTEPVDIVPEPGSTRLFIVEQGGNIRIVNGGTVVGTPFLTITSLLALGGESGLLSMAFHPNYLSNRYFFVYYTNTLGEITVARYSAPTADDADEGSGVVLLTIPKGNTNHNGGKLIFGPDGTLFFGTGDGGSSNDPPNNAQNGSSLLGKMIRLNVDNFATPPYYTIPADNPFTGASPIRDEVWALGLRNPWRWSFDRTSWDMWIADVGQGDYEEVNYATIANSAGANYGWRCREGLHANPNIAPCTPTGGTLIDPVFEYTHNGITGGFSITGGYVYHGTAWPSLNNYYICADYVSGNVFLRNPANGLAVRQTGLPGNISSFGEDNNGELYAVSRTGGTLYSIGVSAVLPVSLVRFSGAHFTGFNELKWTSASEQNTQKYIVEYSLDGRNYLPAGEVAAGSNINGGSYSFKHYINNSGLIRYRLSMMDIDQSSRYSPIILISSSGSKELKIYPTIITNNSLQVLSGFEIQKIDVFTPDGKRVHTKDINGQSGYFSIPLPALQKGMYLVRLTGNGFGQTEKVFIQ